MRKLLLILMLCLGTLWAVPLKVAVSIPPLAEFAEAVGGRHVQVLLLVPNGSTPHHYNPSPRQIKRASKVDLFIKVGTEIEFEEHWLPKLQALNPAAGVVHTSQAISLIPQMSRHEQHDHQSEYDAHVWLAPSNAIEMVLSIAQAFSEKDPKHRNSYEHNAQKYIEKLEKLRQEVRTQLLTLEQRTFITYHSAWSYFAKEFNLIQKSIEINGKEPTVKNIIKIIKLAKARQIKMVLVEPQFSKKSARIISKEIDGVVVVVDPLAKDYIENMYKVVKQLKASFK
jgi:zinc transport system substrate-binding protein